MKINDEQSLPLPSEEYEIVINLHMFYYKFLLLVQISDLKLIMNKSNTTAWTSMSAHLLLLLNPLLDLFFK